MRWFEIALFLVILQTFGAIFINYAESMGIKTILKVEQPSQSEIQQAEQIKSETQIEEQISATDPLSAALGWFYQQLSNLANAIFSASFPLIKYVLWLPLYLQAIGVPPPFAWGVFSIYTIIEVIGFVQFVSGRRIE